MSDAQASYLLGSLFLVSGICNLLWPQWLLGRLKKKGFGSWRMRMILAPFPEKNHPIVLRAIAVLSLLVSAIAFVQPVLPK
jgi:hypothetical protein